MKMSIPNKVLKRRDINGLDKLLLGVLTVHREITQDELAEQLGVSHVTIGTRIRGLHDRGLLQVHRKVATPTKYKVLA